ncbi:MAG: hypothetical protein J4F50_11190 [Acidimicrobiia bacterium]|nr:hypothetical protein [Acidimicrobiia bacterium]
MGRQKVRVTVTIDPDVLTQVKSSIKSGPLRSVSAYVECAVKNQLVEDVNYEAMLAEMLEATGGPLTDEERAEARRILNGGAP